MKKYLVEAKSWMFVEANSKKEAIEDFKECAICEDEKITAKLIKSKNKSK